MARYFQELKIDINIKKIIEVLCGSFEFEEKIIWKEKDNDLIPPLYQKVKAELELQSGEKFERSKNVIFSTLKLKYFII